MTSNNIDGLQALIEYQLLAKEQILCAKNQIKQQKIPLLNWIHQEKILDTKTVSKAFSQYYQIDFYDLATLSMKNYFIHEDSNTDLCHITLDEQSLIFITNPERIHQAKQLKHQIEIQLACSIYIVDYAELIRIINHNQRKKTASLIKNNSDTSPNNLIQQIVDDAVCQNASDIHLDISQYNAVIRLRIDGHLYTHYTIPKILHNNVISVIKLSANLDITQQRQPQDGRITTRTSWQQKQDFRISICPGLYGEKVVLRLIKHQAKIHQFHQLGFTDEQIKLIKKKLDHQSGLILLCGPTGSGKSMTLYTMLQYLNQDHLNILCAEDPVEIPITGIHQVASNHKIKLDFATILRSFLRLDPDIIMLGEMRDTETADIAIKAAQTGHLVLSTLHCDKAVDAHQRLINMGIKAHQLECIQLVIAQRLIRCLCTYCRIPVDQQNIPSMLHTEKPTYQANPSGCAHCIKGYHGRTGIFECYEPSKPSDTLQLSDHAYRIFFEGKCDLKNIQGYINDT